MWFEVLQGQTEVILSMPRGRQSQTEAAFQHLAPHAPFEPFGAITGKCISALKYRLSCMKGKSKIYALTPPPERRSHL